MRRKLMLGAMLTLLLAAASVPLAFAAGGTRDDDVRVIEVTTKTVQEANLDLGEKGFSIGDRLVFSQDVFQGETKVGTGGVDCVVVLFRPPSPGPEAATALCTAAISLSDGQITVQGLVDFVAAGPSFTLAVTGGTGAYRDARGEDEVTQVSATEYRLKITLVD